MILSPDSLQSLTNLVTNFTKSGHSEFEAGPEDDPPYGRRDGAGSALPLSDTHEEALPVDFERSECFQTRALFRPRVNSSEARAF